MRSTTSAKIAFYCTGCRLNLWGNVTALGEEGEVIKVTCRTCNSQRPFKPEKDEADKRKRMLKKALAIRDRRKQQSADTLQSRVVPTTGGSDVTARWRVATDDVNTFSTPHYDPEASYAVGDTLNHTEHGLGMVQQVLHENAMLVLFRKVEIPLEMNVAPPDND